MNVDELKLVVNSLPHLPGIYQFFDVAGKIIYIGKAKDLRKRVSSYFTRSNQSGKVRVLVGKIAEIRHTVVNSESDALLLENSLIKKFQPRYNILLKDDKTYPWIVVTQEEFPRVFITRRQGVEGWRYFGPYTSAFNLRGLLELFRGLYKVRTCKLALTESTISAGNYKVCLEYHLGNCLAPCVGLQSKQSYSESISQIISILKGNTSEVVKEMKRRMNEASQEMRYEIAQHYKLRLENLSEWQVKSTVVSSALSNLDVFFVFQESFFAIASFFRVVNGSVVQSQTFELKSNLDETKEDLLAFLLEEILLRYKFLSREVVVPFMPSSTDFTGIKLVIPHKGDKKLLLDLAEKNCKEHYATKLKMLDRVDPGRRTEILLERIQQSLHLPTPPHHVECFDNSNLQGTNPVASCVVFRDGKPSKREYRHYNVKTVVGANDFASMQEIVQRRYSRLLMEQEPLPDLVVIDGGKGQLSAAYTSLQNLGLESQIPILGLAKRLEEIYVPFDSTPLYLDKNSEALRLLMQIRDEAHRFGITFHRKKRSGKFLQSELDAISGVGEKSKHALLTNFESVTKIKSLSLEELSRVVNKSIALKIYTYFHK